MSQNSAPTPRVTSPRVTSPQVTSPQVTSRLQDQLRSLTPAGRVRLQRALKQIASGMAEVEDFGGGDQRALTGEGLLTLRNRRAELGKSLLSGVRDLSLLAMDYAPASIRAEERQRTLDTWLSHPKADETLRSALERGEMEVSLQPGYAARLRDSQVQIIAPQCPAVTVSHKEIGLN